jgi:hypothetical protein
LRGHRNTLPRVSSDCILLWKACQLTLHQYAAFLYQLSSSLYHHDRNRFQSVFSILIPKSNSVGLYLPACIWFNLQSEGFWGSRILRSDALHDSTKFCISSIIKQTNSSSTGQGIPWEKCGWVASHYHSDMIYSDQVALTLGKIMPFYPSFFHCCLFLLLLFSLFFCYIKQIFCFHPWR